MSTIIPDSGRDPQEVLNGPFDPRVHAKTFINYLEVIIDATGTVHYATPSHLMWLERAYYDELSCDADALYARMPQDANPVSWLCEQLGAVCVWNDRYEGTLNLLQNDALMDLYQRGLYTGAVPIIAEVHYCACDDMLGDVEVIVDRTYVDTTPVLDTYPAEEVAEMAEDCDFNDVAADLDAHHLLKRPYRTWPGPVSVYFGSAIETYARARLEFGDTDESLRDAGIRLYDLEITMLHDRKRDLENEIHAVNVARQQLVNAR